MNRSAPRRTVRFRVHGFTMIEVLVALTIASVALMAAVKATRTLTTSSAELRARTLAQWSAENRLAELRVAGQWPNVGKREFDCSQGGVTLLCREEVLPTPNRFFRRVELNVLAQDGHRLAQLTGFATQFR